MCPHQVLKQKAVRRWYEMTDGPAEKTENPSRKQILSLRVGMQLPIAARETGSRHLMSARQRLVLA